VGAYSRPDSAYRLLQLLTTYEPGTRALHSSQGRRPRPSSFSYASCSFPGLPRRRMKRGEPRISSVRPSPGAGFSRLREVARPRYRIDASHPLPVRADELARLSTSRDEDVHGSLDRVKDVSSSEEITFLACLRTECMRLAHADDVPLLRLPEDTLCRRCARSRRKRPHVSEVRTDRAPRSPGIPRRLPSSGKAGCLSPLRREPREEDFSSSDARAGLSLTPPTLCPQVGGRCFEGHCKCS